MASQAFLVSEVKLAPKAFRVKTERSASREWLERRGQRATGELQAIMGNQDLKDPGVVLDSLVFLVYLESWVLEASLGLRVQKESLVHRVSLVLLVFLELKDTEDFQVWGEHQDEQVPQVLRVLQESLDKTSVLGHLVIGASQGKMAWRVARGQWACMATQEQWV